jgi:hypothetical protein
MLRRTAPLALAVVLGCGLDLQGSAAPAGAAPDAGSSGALPTTDGAAPTPMVEHLSRISSRADGATTFASLPAAAATTRGSAIVVAAMLIGTSAGAVTVTDAANNTYKSMADTADGSGGDRLVLFVALGTTPLGAGDRIKVSFPKVAAVLASADEFGGVTSRAGATFGGATCPPCNGFDSGSLTTAETGLLLGVAAVRGGKPTWAADGWTELPPTSASSDSLAPAFRVAPAGTYSATGTQTGTAWMALVAHLF